MTVVESRLIWAANRTGDDGFLYRIDHTRQGQAGHGLDWQDVVRVSVTGTVDKGYFPVHQRQVLMEKAFDHVRVADASLLATDLALSVRHLGSIWRRDGVNTLQLERERFKKQPDLETHHATRKSNIRANRKPKFTFARK